MTSRGTIALHGGGEFQAGDEAFLTTWLATAQPAADDASTPIGVAVVPTASARGRPDLAGAHGVAAIRRVADMLGRAVDVQIVPVVDAASAADPLLAARLAAARAIHLPGGDPDLVPSTLAGSVAWAAMRAAVAAGATLAGASAGAMGLAAWTWTQAGGQAGLGIIAGPPLLVMPHADAASWRSSLARFGRAVPPGVGILGVGEHTGVLIDGDADAPWRVAGEGEVRWSPAGHDPMRPQVYRDGDAFRPDGA